MFSPYHFSGNTILAKPHFGLYQGFLIPSLLSYPIFTDIWWLALNSYCGYLLITTSGSGFFIYGRNITFPFIVSFGRYESFPQLRPTWNKALSIVASYVSAKHPPPPRPNPHHSQLSADTEDFHHPLLPLAGIPRNAPWFQPFPP